MRELGEKVPSIFDAIKARVDELDREPKPAAPVVVDQLELDLPGIKAVEETVEPEPQNLPPVGLGKKTLPPRLGEFVQYPLQNAGFPYVPVGTPAPASIYRYANQRRRHDRTTISMTRAPRQLSGTR